MRLARPHSRNLMAGWLKRMGQGLRETLGRSDAAGPDDGRV